MIKSKKRGNLIIISGTTCAGKGTVIKHLLERNKNLYLSISYTSRPKRGSEVEGEDYTAGNDTYVFTKGIYQYTFTKAGVPGENITLGYLNETNDDLLQNAFYVGTPIKATGDTVYIAKDEDNV